MTVNGYEVWISKYKNFECLSTRNRFKVTDMDECRQKCDLESDCNFFSVTNDGSGYICKIIKVCKEDEQKLSNNQVATYKKIQGNNFYSNVKTQMILYINMK